MSRSALVVLVAGLLFGGTAAAQTSTPAKGPAKGTPKPTTSAPKAPVNASADAPSRKNSGIFTGGLQVGYYDGMSVHGSITFDNISDAFPLGLRFGYGVTWSNAGDALAARRVFIDNNTNGTARQHGKNSDLRFDVTHPVKVFKLQNTKAFGGVRWNDYTGYFEYIGGNETFDVNGNQWGVGGGLETAYALSPLVDLTFSVGLDYFFKSQLNGHDSYYWPDGTDTNGIGNYTYADADEAINQRDFDLRTLMGVSYKF